MGLLFKRGVFKVFGSFKIRHKDQEPEKGEKENGEKEDAKDNTYYPDSKEAICDPCNKENFKPAWMHDYTNGCSLEYQRDIDEFKFVSNQPNPTTDRLVKYLDTPAGDYLGRMWSHYTISRTKKTTFHRDGNGQVKSKVLWLPEVFAKRDPKDDMMKALTKTGMIRPGVETRIILNKPLSEICESTSKSSFSPNTVAYGVRKTEVKMVKDENGELKKTLVSLPDEIYVFGAVSKRNLVNKAPTCYYPEITLQTLLSYTKKREWDDF